MYSAAYRSTLPYPPPLAGEVPNASEASMRRKGHWWHSPYRLPRNKCGLGTSPVNGGG